MIKKINIFLLLLLAVLFVYLNNNLNNELAYSQEQSEYITFEYVITDITAKGEYYGRSTKDNTGIYFTDENLQSDQIIRKGDKIQATFERDSRIDGIVSIEVKK
ncbi:hypothetical protein AF332_11435 [Sporosarcina globispora]|uniref:Uncharacterized protein n=1 Tax=Sporosarcina globispora TaxID=1459 RepID=A0A0M0GD70_SPOGL|nr:hypothetical protein [Sporosarcina globispora]KON87376.1 hypothetical protein AF332_11435 [Sporosarcina globispora]